MSYAWSVVGRALVGLLLVFLGAVLMAPVFSQVSLSADPTQETQTNEKIELALQQRISLNLIDTPLIEVVSRLADKTNVTIVLTKKIEDAGVQSDQPVSIDVKDVTVETFLKLVLGNLNLTTMVQGEVLKITTIEDAQSPENLVVRIYPVADLLDNYRAPAAEGGGVYANFDPLIDMITSTLEPDSWQDVGGPGSICAHDNSHTLIVSQRRDIHERLAGTLTTLRRAKQLQAVSLQSLSIGGSALPGGGAASLPVRSRITPPMGLSGGTTKPAIGGCIF